MSQTRVFKATLQQEEDGRWSSWIDALPGCATWGYTEKDALVSLQIAAELVVEDMVACGEVIPAGEIDPTTPAIKVAI